MSSTSSGGSNATDFQPTTGNPQENVGGGLQPNSTVLQPITTSGQSNVFNQPGVNPQAFPKTNSLRVISNGTKVQTATSQPNTGSQGWGALALFFIAIWAVAIIFAVLIRVAKPAADPEEKQPEAPQPAAMPYKSKKRSKNKKKTTKKRK